MNKKLKFHCFRNYAIRTAVLTGVCSTLFLGTLQYPEADDTSAPVVDHPAMVERDGYTIPVFSTPAEQLRHTTAWFSDPDKKKASLQALIQKFPKSRKVRAAAELELAYLALGSDYRFASPKQCRTAIAKYRTITRAFYDMPTVCAKANWYIAWILADLLYKNHQAVAHYQMIVDKYPNATLNLEPPVPWVSLVLPLSKTHPQVVYDRPTYYWGSIALLEIVRICDDDACKWAAFQKLYTNYCSSLATGYAIRELLTGPPPLAQKVVAYAHTHLNAMLFGRALAKEIPGLLRKIQYDADPFTDRIRVPK